MRISYKNIIQAEGTHQGKVHIQVSGHVNAVCTSGIFVVVDAIYQQVFLVELHVALYTLIIRIPGTDRRFIFFVLFIFCIHGFQVTAILTDVIFGGQGVFSQQS